MITFAWFNAIGGRDFYSHLNDQKDEAEPPFERFACRIVHVTQEQPITYVLFHSAAETALA